MLHLKKQITNLMSSLESSVFIVTTFDDTKEFRFISIYFFETSFCI